MVGTVWEAIAARPAATLAALPRVAGRTDLRGVRRERTHPVVQVRRARFQSVDFSRGQLASLRFFHCLFQDCLFDEADLDDCRSWGSVFRGCSFQRTRLGGAGMGGGRVPNSFESCDFREADLRDSSQVGARYRDSRFVDCRLTRVHFDATSFDQVSFTGRMDEVRFDAVEMAAGRVRRWRARPQPLVLDLSRSVPRWCEFVGHDLSACVLPRVPGVIAYDRRRDVAKRVLARLAEEPDLVMLKVLMESEVSGAPRRGGGGPGFQVVSALGDTDAERTAAERVLRSVIPPEGRANRPRG